MESKPGSMVTKLEELKRELSTPPRPSSPRSLKDVVKQVIWDNRLSNAFDSLRTQTGDAFMHLDFEKDLTFVRNLGQGAFGTVDCYLLRNVEDDSKPPREVAVKRIKNHVETMAPQVAKITDFGLFTVAPPQKRMPDLPSPKPKAARASQSFIVEPSSYSAAAAKYPTSSPPSLSAEQPKRLSQMAGDEPGDYQMAGDEPGDNPRHSSVLEEEPEEGRHTSVSGSAEPSSPGGPSRRNSRASHIGAHDFPDRQSKRMSLATFLPLLRTYSFTADKFNDPGDYKMTGMTGTLKYMAPESYRCESYNEKVDQYAFSMIMYELLSRKEPYQNSYMLPEDLAESAAYTHRRPKLPKSWPKKLVELHEACWHADPQKRPPFKTIVQLLISIKQDQAVMDVLRNKGSAKCCVIS